MGLLQPYKKVRTHTMTTLYGDSGTGKTTVIGTMPGKVLIIDTDNGLESVSGIDEGSAVAECKTFDDVLEALSYADDFDSIVVDTFDKVQELAIAHVMLTRKKKVYGVDKTSLEDYGFATTVLINLVDELVTIAKKGKNVLVLVHAKQLSEEDLKSSRSKASVTVNTMPKVGGHLLAQSRITGYMSRDFKEEVIKGTKKFKEVYKGTFGGDPSVITKVTRKKEVVAPNVITDVTWDKIQRLTTGKKQDEAKLNKKEDKDE